MASPRYLARELRPSELGLWAALYSIDPWGEQRGDLRAAIVASLIANVNRDTKRRPEPFRPDDFMPYRQRDARAEQQDLSRRLRAVLGTMGGRKK